MTPIFLVFSSGPVQRERLEAKNKSEDEIGIYTPSDWSTSQYEAQETGWARFSFSPSFTHLFTKQNQEQ